MPPLRGFSDFVPPAPATAPATVAATGPVSPVAGLSRPPADSGSPLMRNLVIVGLIVIAVLAAAIPILSRRMAEKPR